MSDWSKTSIIFLDVAASITKGIIETDLYVKLTESHQYPGFPNWGRLVGGSIWTKWPKTA